MKLSRCDSVDYERFLKQSNFMDMDKTDKSGSDYFEPLLSVETSWF